MKVIPTANPGHGFFGTIVDFKKVKQIAETHWTLAFNQIAEAVPTATPVEIRNYLDSVYGRHSADEVVNGRSLKVQIESRRARFLKHFAAIQRQTADGCFEV